MAIEVHEPAGVEHRANGRLGKAAFSDPSIRTNPRIPMVRGIVGLLEAAF